MSKPIMVIVGMLIFCILLFIFVIYPGIANYKTPKEKVQQVNIQKDPIQAPKWNYNLILTFKGHKYDVTKKTTNDIGRMIGTVSYHANGRIFHLYSINNESDNKIAIETKNGYLIATKQNE